MEFVRVDLEELTRRVGWVEKHADYILVSKHVVVVVEETSRAKIDDVRKLDRTVEAILCGPLRDWLSIQSVPALIVAVIHAYRGVDSMISRIVRSRIRRGVVYRIANCDDHLRRILYEHGFSHG